MQFLFIIVAVIAIVAFCATHNIATISDFVAYVHNDLVGLLFSFTLLTVTLGIICLFFKISSRR